MPRSLRKLAAFVRRDVALAASYRLAWMLASVDVVLTIGALYFLGVLVDSGDADALVAYPGYFSFAMVGAGGFTYFLVAVGQLVQSIRNAQLDGTLEAVLVTRTSAAGFVALTYSGIMLVRTVFMALYVVVAWSVFGLALDDADWGSALLLIVLTAAVFLGIGMISGAFIVAFKKGDPLTWALGALSWLLSGTLYPVEILPDWLETLAELFPVTPLLRGLRKSLLDGAGVAEVAPEAVVLCFFAFATLTLGWLSLNRAVDHARQRGTLGHY